VRRASLYVARMSAPVLGASARAPHGTRHDKIGPRARLDAVERALTTVSGEAHLGDD
jgi:hypothetical protein